MNTNKRLDPSGTNPVNSIPDPLKNDILWDKFLLSVGTEARRMYEEKGITSLQLAGSIRQIALSTGKHAPFVYDHQGAVVFTAFAYHLHMHEILIREFATAAVALHHPRKEIFVLVLYSKFGLTPADLDPHFSMVEGWFNDWLGTFGPDILRPEKEE